MRFPYFFYYDQELQRARETALTNQKHAADLASTTIAQTLAFVVSDLRYLSDQNELKDFLAEDSPLHRTRIAEEHSAFLNQKPSYDQVRLTGSDGWELIRVDRRGCGVTITPADRLQEEAKRPSFVETMRLGAGEIYVGPMDLNVEEGSIEEPPNPALPVALPLFDASGHKVAVLALHFHAEQLLARLRTITPPDGSELSLLNGEGYWLLSPSAADEWAFMYPDRADLNLPARDPETWRRLSDAESGAFDTPEGLLVFAHLHPLLPTEPLALQARHLRQPAAAADYHWTIVAKLPTAVLQSQKVTLAGQLLVAYIAVAIFAFGLSSMIAFLALRSRAISRFVQHVLDHVPDLIAYIDADERFRFNNRHYQTMFGLPPGDFWGSTVRSILGDAAYERARPHIKTALAGTSVSFEASMTYAVAGRCDISATYIPDTGEDGRIWGFLAVVTDVTPLKAAESRERQRLLEIAHATRLASVGEMATQIAHEVNQPLTAIVAYCATAQRCLQAALPGDSRLDRLLGFITDDANRVSSIVRRIRSFVRRGQISVATIDMNEIVADSLRFVASDAASHGVTLSRQLAREPLNVVADRVLLSQATFNLLRNAIEAIAGDTGGERLVTVSTRRRSQAVEVSVRDTGAGLAPEMSAHLCEAFMTTKPEGLGMGLSIARSIIEAHGGRIHYSHTVEDGTTFSFIVPGASP